MLERATLSSTQRTLVAADYFLMAEEGMLHRMPDGTRWGEEVVVAYGPRDDRPARRSVVIELVRLVLSRTAYQSESVGGEYSYSIAEGAVDQQRAVLMRSLGFQEV